MNLFQVRKGQFVYFNNELHRVYAVKPVYKLSIHLMRLRDLSQHLCSAKEIERYQPKEHDSFIFNYKKYTLSKKVAEVGDYILITNPDPDYLDHYSLNEIEIVASVDRQGVITNHSNGIKHSEYLLMVPGRHEESKPIEYKDPQLGQTLDDDQSNLQDELSIAIGDIYRKTDNQLETMVIATQGTTIFLGAGFQLPQEVLLDPSKWEFQYNLLDIPEADDL